MNHLETTVTIQAEKDILSARQLVILTLREPITREAIVETYAQEIENHKTGSANIANSFHRRMKPYLKNIFNKYRLQDKDRYILLSKQLEFENSFIEKYELQIV